MEAGTCPYQGTRLEIGEGPGDSHGYRQIRSSTGVMLIILP
jgi:hypothetical protein